MNQTDWQKLITTPLKETKPYWFVHTQNGTRVYETVNRDQAVKYAKSNSTGGADVKIMDRFFLLREVPVPRNFFRTRISA